MAEQQVTGGEFAIGDSVHRLLPLYFIREGGGCVHWDVDRDPGSQGGQGVLQ
jgi:hypothetical protein